MEELETPQEQEQEEIHVDEFLSQNETAEEPPVQVEETQLRAVLEAIIYVAEEPITIPQLVNALQRPAEQIQEILGQLVAEFDKPEHGMGIREVAGGYKIATKPEHHDA